MPNATGWKQFERAAAALIGGKRFWSNSGEALDVESSTVVGQCKYVRDLSLAKLGELAQQVEREAAPKFKAGVVIVKQSGHKGNRRAPTLVVMTEATWRQMHGPSPPPFFAPESSSRD